MADHGQEMIRAASATPATMYNGAAATSSEVPVTRGGDNWWSTTLAPPVPSCSAPEMPGFSTWSAESPRSNSLPTGSSVTFQEPAGVADPYPATIAAGWNQSFLDGSGLSGGYMSSRSDQDHANPPRLMSPSSSNNNSSMMLQLQDHHHDQNYQFLSTLGFELLSSPVASPYGGNTRSSSLLRSLTEPSAQGKPNSPAALQRYLAPATCQTAATSNTGSNTPFWNPSTGFDSAAYAASLEAAAGPPPAQSRLASLATKSASAEGVGDSTSILTKKTSRSAPPPSLPLKKKRTETQPSQLPTFKVRKEKLGDRVTALQQLVSPFGKTDTASVLHETIEYIKFLHDQVGVSAHLAAA
uniref:Uncharacterized protein n=1 Tax=Avena sativa TaxID=4498 RepID=A0ACD6AJ49_AVESA